MANFKVKDGITLGANGILFNDGSTLTTSPSGPSSVANDGVLTIATSGTGLTGSGTFTANQSTNTSITITLDSSSFLKSDADDTATGDITFTGNVIIDTSDTDIFLGNILSGTVSTDSGMLFTGSTSNVSGIFTEVDGTILSLGINIPQIDSNYSNTISGGIFRFDTRTTGSVGNKNCFIVYRRPAGEDTFYQGLIVDLNDGNTLLTPAGGYVGIAETNPSANLHVSGNVIMDNGETASSFRFGNTSYDSSFVTSDIFVLAANETAPGLTILSASDSSSGHRGVFKAVRSRGSLTSPTAAQDGDFIFSLLGAIHDGSTTRATAAIEMVADGAVSSGVAPQRIGFYTGPTTSRTERMRIANNGNILIGSTTDNDDGKLQVTGDVTISSSTAPTLTVKTTAGSSYDADFVLAGARTASSTSDISSIRLRNETSSPYDLVQINARDPSGSHTLGNGKLVIEVSSGGTLSEILEVTSTGASVNGLLSATTKSFIIDHPTKKGKKLRYGSLEGPENGVYVRGETTSKIIKLPQYWTKLVHADSITVNLTAKGEYQQLFVEKIENNKVYIKNAAGKTINCYYTIYGERADVEKFEVEYADNN